MSATTGLGELVRLALRRDRVRLPGWIGSIVAATAGTAASFPTTYPDAQARLGALMTIDNPGTTALVGPLYGEGDYTYGIMVGHQLLGMVAVVAALMSIFTVVRHTRAEEESGRAELVRAAPVGRTAPALAALVVAVGANLVLAAGLTLALGGLGIETVTWRGSALFGAAVGAVGLVLAGVASVTAQLTEHARAASSMAGLVLAAAFVVRATGDVSVEGLSWASPIGWAQATEPFYADDGAPLALALGLAVVLLAGAVVLGRRRDLGSGLLTARPGPARAGSALSGPFGLAWRTSRGSLVGWTLGVFFFGLFYGPILSESSTFLDNVPVLEEFVPDVEASVAELFAAMIIAVVAIICAIPALQTVLRLRTEETSGRAGPLLATALSRTRWALANHVLALLAGAVVLTAGGLGLGLGAAWSMDEPSWVGTATGAALAYLPAVAVVVGLGALLHGWVPRAVGAAWLPVVVGFFFSYFGELLDLPQAVLDVSPFTHVSQQPAVAFEAAPLAWLSLVALLAIGLGLAGLRRRDLLDA